MRTRMNKPDYRMRIEIYDDQVGEVVSAFDTYLSEIDEDNVPNLYRALQKFKKAQESHEADHYPKESEYEEQE